jgi:hypothetical protein
VELRRLLIVRSEAESLQVTDVFGKAVFGGGSRVSEIQNSKI